MATQLSRTFGSQGNQRKFTISVWVKRSNLTTGQSIFGSGGSGNYATRISFDSNDRIDFWNYFNGAYQGRKVTNRKFRDTNGYYHIVIRVDSTSATASERMRIYVNGEEETSFSTSSNPSQNQTFEIGHTGAHYIGGYGTGADFEGYMSHFHYCDGQSYAPTEFGEYDANGVWKIKTDVSVTYGTNGFFILKDGNSVTDQSGNGNNWTVAGGTLTNTEDNPSNVFATLDALQDYYGWHDLSNGNTSVTFSGSTRYGVSLTNLGMSSGKYYCEVKCVAEGSPKGLSIGTVNKQIGFGQYEYLNGNGYAYWRAGNGVVRDNASNTEYTGNTWGTGDILMMALDVDNNNLYFGKNGTWENSGVPTSGATGTGAVTLSASPDFPFFFCCDRNDGGNPQFSWNFGNGYFGTTAVASAGTNASGIGIFEYDVPTGYTALSTKGLNL